MSLIKGNKEDVQGKPSLKKSSLFRSGDFSQGTFVEPPSSREEEPGDQEEPSQPFQEGLEPPPVSSGKVFGGRAHAPVQPFSSRPPALAHTVRIPSGGASDLMADPVHNNRGHNDPQQAQSAQAETPPAQPYNPGPPIDQAIIEEARKKALQIQQEAQVAANQMLMEYQTQAQQMMEQAQQQIQASAEQVQHQAHETGLQNGYQEGVRAGAEAAQQQLGQLMMQVRDVYVQAIKQRQWLMASVEPELARLSIKVAEKILGQEVQTQPEAIVGIVRAALAGIGDREEVSIRVNPADFEAAQGQKSNFERMVEGLKKFEIVADQAIDQGGCSIETNLGNIDARLNTQLITLQVAMEAQAQAHEAEIKEAIEVEARRMMQEGG